MHMYGQQMLPDTVGKKEENSLACLVMHNRVAQVDVLGNRSGLDHFAQSSCKKLLSVCIYFVINRIDEHKEDCGQKSCMS